MTAPVVVFPDIELWAADYLRRHLLAYDWPNVYVGNAYPKTPRAQVVTVRRDGGASRDVRDFPRLGINVWAGSEFDASSLAAMVRALLRASTNDGPILRAAEMSGPSPIADENGKSRRYMTFEFVTRGEAVV